MDFAINEKLLTAGDFESLPEECDSKNRLYLVPRDISLSEDMKTAQIYSLAIRILGAACLVGSGLCLHFNAFKLTATLLTLGLTVFASIFCIDMSFYPYSVRREEYHREGQKMSLEAYISCHGFERFKQYGPSFQGLAPLITQQEFSKRFFAENPTFREPKKKGFLFACLKSGFFTREDISRIERLFLKECPSFYDMCTLGLFDLLGLGLFKESTALKHQLFTHGAWDEAELLFEHSNLIKQYHLIPKEIQGVSSFIEEHASSYQVFKAQHLNDLKEAHHHREKALRKAEEENKLLIQKLQTGFFETHPDDIQALDKDGILQQEFDQAAFYEVIMSHTERRKKVAEKAFIAEANSLKKIWESQMAKLNEICASYKRLAFPALRFYQMPFENFIDTYGFDLLEELIESESFSISRAQVAERLFDSRPGRKNLFKDGLVFDLWERGFFSVRTCLELEQKILITQNFLSIAHEALIWRPLEKGLISSATKGKLRKLLDQALSQAPASHLIACWSKIRACGLATNPENISLYQWLDQHMQAYGGVDAEFNAYRASLSHRRDDQGGYNPKKSSFGQVILEDERNWPTRA